MSLEGPINTYNTNDQGESVQVTKDGKKDSKPSKETIDLVAKIHEKYYKDLFLLCRSKIDNKNFSTNLEYDAEDILAILFERLLKTGTKVDLNRPKYDVIKYLSLALDRAIANYITYQTAQKRNPRGGKISLEDIFKNNTEKSIKHPYLELEEKEKFDKINKAIKLIEKRHKTMADILRESYFVVKTDLEIAAAHHVSPTTVANLKKTGLKIIKDIIEGKITDESSIPKE